MRGIGKKRRCLYCRKAFLCNVFSLMPEFFFAPAEMIIFLSCTFDPTEIIFSRRLSACVDPPPAVLFFFLTRGTSVPVARHGGPQYLWPPPFHASDARTHGHSIFYILLDWTVPIIGTKNKKRNEFTSYPRGIPPHPPEFVFRTGTTTSCQSSCILFFLFLHSLLIFLR